MSPASADGLRVDRYVGGYLVASSARDHHRRKPPSVNYVGPPNVYGGGYVAAAGPVFRPYGHNSWAGVPLISTAHAADRRNRRPQQPPPFPRQQPVRDFSDNQLPLSRLALHARGAPLILSRRYNNNNNHANRKPSCPNNNNNNNYKPDANLPRPVPQGSDSFGKIPKEQTPPARASPPQQNVDSLSVTSDESSGSANSETCLPRIIKPRKRRKKDRKPAGDGKAESPPEKPRIDEKPQSQAKAIEPARSVGDDDSDDSSSLFEAIGRCSPTVCECKYCDASEQLWDFDRFCYSSLFSDEDTWSEPRTGCSVESLRITDEDNPGAGFGPVGAGRRAKSQETPDWKATAVPRSPERVPEILFDCFPSRGVNLDVSPSISANGHREIKFFSARDSEVAVQ